MNGIPTTIHPLQRDGRSQAQRDVKALVPPSDRKNALERGNAMVDERSLADFLCFILEYSRQVRFEHLEPLNGQARQNGHADSDKWRKKNTDWATLLRQSPLFTLAGISKTDTAAIREQFEHHAEDAVRFEGFEGIHLLLDLTAQVLFQIHRWALALAADASTDEQEQDASPLDGAAAPAAPFRPFGKVAEGIITANLSSAAQRLIVQAKAASNHLGYRPAYHFSELQTLKAWGEAPDRTPNSDQENQGLTGGVGSHRTQVKAAIRQIRPVFGELLAGMQEIVARSGKALGDTIQNNHAHAPHIGLMLSFFELLEKARNNPGDDTGSYLNAAMQKHLDFFYKQVLAQTLKPALPDKAHLVFEIAKHLTNTHLDKGTAFLGGKDANGAPVVFKLDEEIIVTRAQVDSLKTLYLKSSESPVFSGSLAAVYAAPVANSANGLGGAFPKGSLPAWKTLGWHESKWPDASRSTALVQKFHPQPEARLGLLVASKLFHLEGGRREVDFAMDCDWLAAAPGEVRAAFSFPDFKKAVETRLEITAAVAQELKKEGLLEAGQFLSGKVAAEPYSYEDYEAILSEIDGLAASTAEQKAAAKSLVARLAVRHHAFDVLLSGEKAWLRPYDVRITATDQPPVCSIVINITLDPDLPAVSWYSPDVHGEKLDTVLPALRLELRQAAKISSEVSPYHFLRYLYPSNLRAKTTVQGFGGFLLQTEEGAQDPHKAFTAFGAAPKTGAAFSIGSSEIFGKRWDDLTLNITWKDKPEPFNAYYYNYEVNDSNDEDVIKESAFKVNAAVLLKQAWVGIPPVSALFTGGSNSVWKFENTTANQPNEDPAPLEPLTAFTKAGFARFALDGESFRHSSFPQRFSLQAQAQALIKLDPPQFVHDAIYKKPGVAGQGAYVKYTGSEDFAGFSVELPNTPYTPVIESLRLDYTAHSEIGDFEVYHLHPFEGGFQKQELPGPTPILPFFHEEGALFLGISNLVPGDNLDLLFQVAESTADPDLQPADVQWYYLADNAWEKLEMDADVLSDDTGGLLRSGVVKIAVPSGINLRNTILPPHLHWLKAAAPHRANAVSETVAVHTQAAKATFALAENSDTARLSEPLKAGTVSKPQVENTAVKKINQPYPSFGGLPAEAAPKFYRRVSEHLRHKGRAINLFDYERLVLEHFPEIYKVKCINHTLGLPEEERDFHLAPGHVTVAVIPNLAQLPLADRLRPKATRSLLNKIEAFLKKRTSPFVRVRVHNPRYQPFRVQGKVRFVQGKSVTFYQQQLQKDLERFLSPWAFEAGKEIDFGGVVYKSVILRFIEQLAYVDYVTDFSLLRKKAPGLAVQGPDTLATHIRISGISFPAGAVNGLFNIDTPPIIEKARALWADYDPVHEIPADTARSILVGEAHVFEVLSDDCCKPNGNAKGPCMTGLGYMTVGAGCAAEEEPGGPILWPAEADCGCGNNDTYTRRQ